MAAAKQREIYAKLGVQLRNNRRIFKAERLAPGAFGLYVFCVLDTRAELQDGFVSEEVVMGALARPHKERLAQAEALCKCDLLERVEGGFRVIKYEEHNDTKADVEANREAARQRKDKSRHGHVTRDINDRHAEVPISISISRSGSDQKEITPEEIASVRARPDPGAKPPDWWAAVLATVEMQTGETIAPGEAWLRYAGHRAGKNLPANREDALYWLTTVMVPEARKARAEARRQAERDAKYDRARAGPGTTTEPIVESREEREARAAEIERQTRERKARERGAA
jgi:hypothetical protein